MCEQALGWSPLGLGLVVAPGLFVYAYEWRCICSVLSLDYLNQIAGPRTVPIELGSRYTDKEWTQKLMTLSEFITNHISNKVRNDAGIV